MTLREGLNLFWVQAHNTKIYQPSEPLLLDLQTERRLSTAYLGAPGDQQRQDLAAQRQKTEQAGTEFKKSVQSWQANPTGDAGLQQRVDKVVAGLDGLAATRASIDSRAIDRTAASSAFTDLIGSLFDVYDALGSLDDKDAAADAAALIQLNRTWELMSQEDALLTGSIAAGTMTADERARFTQIVGAQRFLGGETAARLPSADRARYDQMIGGKAFTTLRAIEDRVILEGRSGAKPPATKEDWRTAVDPALTDLHNVVVTGGKDLVERSTPIAIWVFVRLLLAAGLGLVTVIASIIVSITTARRMLRQLERLRDAARQLADERLPSVVARLSRGEAVDVEHEAPPLEFGNDEIGQVGRAFNAVQQTAIQAAVEQADLRRSVRDVFLSIARRSQSLIHRQLNLLDGMERQEGDEAKLDGLFRVDHLATRMRRNAENLIVLAGASPGRVWRRTVPMHDIVRGAIAEVEEYERVTVQPIGPVVELAGRAVSDVTHLLAELVENALSFSPPHTEVHIKGQRVGTGYVLEVEDRGLGIAEDDLAALNERIASHPEFVLGSAARLGLFVVSRLAERHGIKIQLRESAYGGTTAIVLIPLELLGDGSGNTDDGSDGIPAASLRASAVRGSHQLEGSVDVEAPTARGQVALAERPPAAHLDLDPTMTMTPGLPQRPPRRRPLGAMRSRRRPPMRTARSPRVVCPFECARPTLRHRCGTSISPTTRRPMRSRRELPSRCAAASPPIRRASAELEPTSPKIRPTTATHRHPSRPVPRRAATNSRRRNQTDGTELTNRGPDIRGNLWRR
ncbi:sensor histidine kinase [Dactylosporangium darangshiense]|uniref:sensor histidine kinase n=1 Tax=Dactylosporangium darangshiense TaxID=579108 RepID=UPI003643F945